MNRIWGWQAVNTIISDAEFSIWASFWFLEVFLRIVWRSDEISLCVAIKSCVDSFAWLRFWINSQPCTARVNIFSQSEINWVADWNNTCALFQYWKFSLIYWRVSTFTFSWHRRFSMVIHWTSDSIDKTISAVTFCDVRYAKNSLNLNIVFVGAVRAPPAESYDNFTLGTFPYLTAKGSCLSLTSILWV